MEPTVPKSTRGSVQAQLDAQNREIVKLKDDAITKERSSDAVADDLRSQVNAQQINIEQLTDIAAANKETSDASTEHLQAQVDSIQQEVEVLSQTVASQGAAIDEIRKESEPEELRHAYTEYLKAAAADLGSQYHKEQETHAETQRQLAELTDTIDDARDDSKEPRSIPSVD